MAPRKQKDAVALVFDVGKSMQKSSQSRNNKSTIFQEAKRCLIKILEQKIFSESPNEYVLILCGSNETKNGLKLHGSSQYSNIFVYENLRRPTFDLLQWIETIEATANEANIADAIVVSADVLHTQTAGQKFSALKIVFFTNFGGPIDLGDFQNTIDTAIVPKGIHLIFICDVIVGNAEICSKFIEEQQNANLCSQVISALENWCIYSFDEAKSALTYIEPKKVESAAWFANIYFGSLFAIPIVGYIKTTQSKIMTWKKYKKDETVTVKNESIEESELENGNFSTENSTQKVIAQTEYHIVDTNEKVDEADVIRGYAYGSTIVPLTTEDEEAMQYRSERKGFEILFFTSKQNIKVNYNCGDKTMIIAVSHKVKDEKNTAIFMALARALHETECVAIVRYCRLEKYTSQLGYLAPIIDAEKVVFTYIRLPFAEDLRYYNFPAFNKANKDIPTEEQLSLIDDLISCMDLSKSAVDDDGNQCEAFVCEQTNDPNIQTVFNLILRKYVKEVEPENDTFSVSNMFSEHEEKILLKLKNMFPLESMEEKRSLSPSILIETENKKIKTEVTSKGEDVEVEINISQPRNSFEEHVKAGRSWSVACSKLEDVILKLSTNLMGLHDKKILDCLEGYRICCIEKQSAQTYNTFLYAFKQLVKGRSLWKSILQRKLAVITKMESESSGITLEEADHFASIR